MNLLTTENLISALKFIAKPLLILLVCKVIINLVSKASNKLMNTSKLDRGIQTFGLSALKIAMWVIAIIIITGEFGINTSSLVTLLGVASLALSLSVQDIFTNVFSGIIILLTKPFSVGDFIETCGVAGTVTSIELMRTTVTTGDNKVELLTNSEIASSRITNYSTEGTRRVELKITASYDASTDSVKEAINEVLTGNKNIIQDKDKLIAISAYNANDIEYIIRFWVNNSDYWSTYYEVNEKIRESFNKHNIEFSYPHVVVHTTK